MPQLPVFVAGSFIRVFYFSKALGSTKEVYFTTAEPLAAWQVTALARAISEPLGTLLDWEQIESIYDFVGVTEE